LVSEIRIRGQSRTTYLWLLAITCAILLVLPFITTYDDFLTSGAIRVGLDRPLQWVVPAEARAVVFLLSLLGVPASSYGSQIVLHTSGYSQPLFISWNCIGWQSLTLFGLSLVTGLAGNHPFQARLQVVMIGLLGTVLVNLARVTGVCLIASSAGYVPAVLFHDYGGTLMVVAWLFGFWWLAHGWLLGPATEPTGSRSYRLAP
jgi:exosortase/archaeosortase family protein